MQVAVSYRRFWTTEDDNDNNNVGATFMKAKIVKEVPCGHAPRNFPPKSNVVNLSFCSALAMRPSPWFLQPSSSSVSLLLLAAQRNRKRAPARGTLWLSAVFFFVKSLSSWAAKRAAVSSSAEKSAFFENKNTQFYLLSAPVFNGLISRILDGCIVGVCVKKFL